VNRKHELTSIKISEELCGFIPFCLTQNCQWIGEWHFDKGSARAEGDRHLLDMRPAHAAPVKVNAR
jgi:hypothetical protein